MTTRPPDRLLTEIADYVLEYPADRQEARDTARLCLLDSLGCAMLALNYHECARHIQPVVPGATLPGGARVPGTDLALEPVHAAFCIGTLVRWLDYNDTWLAAEWGHPSDNLGAVLAVADYLGRSGRRKGSAPLTVDDILTAMIKAHEIQGVLALENSFNRVGLDHVILVKSASAAVATALLGGDRQQLVSALSNAFLDGGSLRAYRHAPNTGPRKSWAAGDATSRGVRLALMATTGEMAYPTALSAPDWGFQNVLFKGQPLRLSRPLESYVMENVLFKVVYPAEFHAQTAAEAAVILQPQVASRLKDVAVIRIETQEAAMRIINKTGPLHNPADRDHCLQFVVATALIHGRLEAAHYQDAAARDPRIDALREKMTVTENPAYSRAYLDPGRRSIANSLQIEFKDGQCTERVEVSYPVGHPRRRAEAIPLLMAKSRRNLASRLPKQRTDEILSLWADADQLDKLPVEALLGLFVPGRSTHVLSQTPSGRGPE